MSDWTAWQATLANDDRALVNALESGDTERLREVKGVKRRQRALADKFREFRQG